MKMIAGFGVFLLALMAGGWLAEHITAGGLIALMLCVWLAFVIWMIRGYRDLLRQQHQKDRHRV